MLKFFFKSSFTFDTFILFFQKKKFARLQIGLYIGRNIALIKTGKIGKNVGFSGTNGTSYNYQNLNVNPQQNRITFHTLL